MPKSASAPASANSSPLAGYYTQYANQIQSITTFLAGSSGATETYYTNVGRVKAYGLEFAGSYKSGFLKGLAYANLHATWNHARLRDNVIAVPTTYYTAGKALPDAGGAQSLPRNYGQIGPELPPARKLGLIDGAGDADLVRAHNTIDQVIDPERRVSARPPSDGRMPTALAVVGKVAIASRLQR
jgi:outer membrane receptor protein involved in Fe transport